MNVLVYATLYGCLIASGLPLQLQCYHCEEYSLDNDCSSPQFIVNCTANIQNACQKEVLVGSDGVSYRKVCASFTTCLIVSAGYQSFCSPGKVGSVCISCCNTQGCRFGLNIGRDTIFYGGGVAVAKGVRGHARPGRNFLGDSC